MTRPVPLWLQGIFIFIMFVGTGRVRRMLVERVLNRGGSKAVTSNSSTKSTRALSNGVHSNGHAASATASATASASTSSKAAVAAGDGGAVVATTSPPPPPPACREDAPAPRQTTPPAKKLSVTFLTRDHDDDIGQDSGAGCAGTPDHVPGPGPGPGPGTGVLVNGEDAKSSGV